MRLTARCTRLADGWHVEVPEIRGLTTQVRRLSQVKGRVLDAATLLTESRERGSFEITLETVLHGEDLAVIESAVDARREAATAQYRATLATLAAADHLRARGLTSREVATVLGVDPKTIFELGT